MGMGLRHAREQVEDAIAAGATLEEVEADVLARAPLPAELRDALWLYAWGLAERGGQRVGRSEPPPARVLS